MVTAGASLAAASGGKLHKGPHNGSPTQDSDQPFHNRWDQGFDGLMGNSWQHLYAGIGSAIIVVFGP